MVSLRDAADWGEDLRRSVWPLPTVRSVDRLLSWIGEAEIVFLGESTRGTDEFQTIRGLLTRRLIEELDFSTVAVEADWRDAHLINRFAHGLGGPRPDLLLEHLGLFPAWVWRNTAAASFAGWMQEHNRARPERRRIGFHGLDLQATAASLRAAAEYVRSQAPGHGPVAEAYFSSLEQFGPDADEPACLTWQDVGAEVIGPCVRHLLRLREGRAGWLRTDGPLMNDERFYEEQEGWASREAAEFYQTLLGGRTRAVNARCAHLWKALERLRDFEQRRGRSGRIVVWAGNAQIASALPDAQRVSLGEWARQHRAIPTRSIALTTYAGTVAAAPAWGAPAEVMTLAPPLAESVEHRFHEIGIDRFFLPMDQGVRQTSALAGMVLQRCIGAVYRPEQERWHHYLDGTVADQFDAILHLDTTRASEPLEHLSEWDPGSPLAASRAERSSLGGPG